MMQIARIKEITLGLLDWVANDLKNATSDEETFLYKVLGDSEDGSFNFFKQAKGIYGRNAESSRKIGVSMEFPRDRMNVPLYVVREPRRIPNQDAAIGGYVESYMGIGDDLGEYRDTKQFSFTILCVSENFLESILLSEVLYSLYLAAWETLNKEFTRISFGLEEVVAESNIFPIPLFMRAINLNFSSENYVPPINTEDLAHFIKFQYEPGIME